MCAAGEKSAAKMGAREFPRVLIMSIEGDFYEKKHGKRQLF